MKHAAISTSGSHPHRGAGPKQKFPRHPSTPIPLPDGEIDPDQAFAEGARDSIEPDLRHRLISEAAFDLYAKRGFVDGYDQEDWLSAEAQVDHLLLYSQFSSGE
jgi:hypothetical protein